MTTTEMPRHRRADWRTNLWGRTRGHAIKAAGRVRAWRVTLALPGVAGAAMISVGAGLRFGLWAGLVAGGIFALRIDGRI